MRIQLGDNEVPYPLFTIKGRLRLSGLDDSAISELLLEEQVLKFKTVDALISYLLESLESYETEIQSNFETLTRYEQIRGENQGVPAIIVVLEGASATGKSLIALELMKDLAATRFISTDSVRMVLRGILSQEKYPEIFCHTYQAHKHRQTGPKNLDPILRGYLAQCEVILPHIVKMTEGIVAEGANAVIEGVHLQPGAMKDLNTGVVEVLINPPPSTHKAMFSGKHNLEKLRTVSEDINVREREFEATRSIQEYMLTAAKEREVSIVQLISYEEARKSISSLILERVGKLLESLNDGANRK